MRFKYAPHRPVTQRLIYNNVCLRAYQKRIDIIYYIIVVLSTIYIWGRINIITVISTLYFVRFNVRISTIIRRYPREFQSRFSFNAKHVARRTYYIYIRALMQYIIVDLQYISDHYFQSENIISVRTSVRLFFFFYRR